jgi:hypothetical protein
VPKGAHFLRDVEHSLCHDLGFDIGSLGQAIGDALR